MSAFRDIEVVVIRPKPGAETELLAIRVQLLEEYRAAFGDRFDAVLSEETPGRWVDVWSWVSRADAEHALSHRELIPSFSRWEELVELESLTWATVIG